MCLQEVRQRLPEATLWPLVNVSELAYVHVGNKHLLLTPLHLRPLLEPLQRILTVHVIFVAHGNVEAVPGRGVLNIVPLNGVGV